MPTHANSGSADSAAYDVIVSTPAIIRSDDLVEEILDTHRDHARGDDAGYRGYRGHVYRVLNFARVLVPDGEQRDAKLAVAAAFHDLDVFSTLDYLIPSIRAQDAWLKQTGRETWAPELAVVVAEHHRFLTYRGEHAWLAEGFRRADLVDVSQGLIRFGISREYVRAVRDSFDVGTFFTRVIPRMTGRHLRRHPLNPLPHMRGRRALTQAGHTDVGT